MAASINNPNRRNTIYKLLRVILLSIAFATVVSPHFIYSQNQNTAPGIGKIANIIGKIDILRGGKTIPGEKDAVIFETDELQTYDKTAVKLLFNDGSNLMAFQNAHIKLIEYKIKAKTESVNDVKSAIDVVKGKVRFFVKPQESEAENGKTDAKFKTSNSVMGIRGTSGFIDASIPGNTQVIVTTGTVQVTSIADPSKSVVVAANLYTEIVGNRAPTIPKVIPPAILNKLNSDAKALDPNFKIEDKRNNNKNNQGKESGSTGSPNKENKLGSEKSNSSSPEIASGVTEQRKIVFNPDGSSTVISTNSSLNDLLVSQGNNSLRPKSYADYDPIKNSLQQISDITSQLNRQIDKIVQTSTAYQLNKNISIIVNSPSTP